MRYLVTFKRLNSTYFTIHINTFSLTQAERIARDYLRDGETVIVELAK